MRLNLLNLLARNAKRGEFRAEGNTIYLYDIVVGDDLDAEWFGGVSPAAFLRQLKGMSGTVHLRINSPGGEVFAGVAIAQAIREFDGEVVAHVDGVAASIASVIAVACDRVVMAPGSMLMIHKAWTFALGNADELQQTAGLLTKIDGQISERYAAKSGGTTDAAAFLDLMEAETWFTAAEAIDAGLADEAVEEKPKSAKAQARAWDLSAFLKPPSAQSEDEPPIAPAPAEDVSPAANPVRDPENAPAEPPADVEASAEAAANEHRCRVAAVALLGTVA